MEMVLSVRECQARHLLLTSFQEVRNLGINWPFPLSNETKDNWGAISRRKDIFPKDIFRMELSVYKF